MPHTYRLSCISLCSSILQLLNRVKSFGGHSVSVEGWVAKFALLCHFAGVSPSWSPEWLSEEKANNRVYATRKLTIPKDCILSITVFHVAVVLTKRRRERRRWTWAYLRRPCFCKVCGTGGIWNPECRIRNPFLLLFVENHFAFTI